MPRVARGGFLRRLWWLAAAALLLYGVYLTNSRGAMLAVLVVGGIFVWQRRGMFTAGVLGGGPVRVEGVGRESIQGDVEFAGTLARLGADIRFEAHAIEARRGRPLDGGTLDCTTIPDAAMTLAMTALFATAPTTLTAIGSWRVKETDRIAAMATELAKLGAGVEAGADWLRVTPPARWTPATIDTYDDHRMAMCFSLAVFGGAGVTIRDPGCVAKTFPDYFARFGSLVR